MHDQLAQRNAMQMTTGTFEKKFKDLKTILDQAV